MAFDEFMKMAVTLYMTSNNYSIEFNLCDDDGGSTFTINNIHELGEILKDNIAEWRMKKNEYLIQILNIKITEV